MALDYQVDSIEGMDEAVAALYVQDGDIYRLDVEGVPTVEAPGEPAYTQSKEPVELKNTLTKVRNEKKELEKQLKQYKSVDLDYYKQLEQELSGIKESEKLRQEKEAEEIARKNGEWETQKKSLIDTYQVQLNEKEERLGKMNASIQKHLLDAEITKTILSADGNLDILKPHVLQHLSVVDEDGDFVVRVKDKDGNVRINNDGEPMSTIELLEEFKAMPAFQGEGIFKKPKKAGGSSSTGNKVATQTMSNPFSKDNPNYTEQALLLKKDPALAVRLKKEAGL
jgi:hypothetical protein